MMIVIVGYAIVLSTIVIQIVIRRIIGTASAAKTTVIVHVMIDRIVSTTATV